MSVAGLFAPNEKAFGVVVFALVVFPAPNRPVGGALVAATDPNVIDDVVTFVALFPNWKALVSENVNPRMNFSACEQFS